MSKTFIDVPELDWIWNLAEYLEDQGVEHDAAEKIRTAYKYLLWSRRYALTHQRDEAFKVCNGMVTKYHRKLYGMELTPYEKKQVDEAKALYKKLKAKDHDDDEARDAAADRRGAVEQRRVGKRQR